MRDDFDQLVEIVDALCHVLVRTDKSNEQNFMALKSIADRARKLRQETLERPLK